MLSHYLILSHILQACAEAAVGQWRTWIIALDMSSVPTTSSWGGEQTWISWTADRTQDPLPKRGFCEWTCLDDMLMIVNDILWIVKILSVIFWNKQRVTTNLKKYKIIQGKPGNSDELSGSASHLVQFRWAREASVEPATKNYVMSLAISARKRIHQLDSLKYLESTSCLRNKGRFWSLYS